jgi:hypothetical protein
MTVKAVAVLSGWLTSSISSMDFAAGQEF